ncbi:hypothetical protein [Streptomyces sp. NBC_01546]|uniref:hypothetical protein n=1 Tax=Streptomyces sp. NBC_01546 TaxID=2975872 RepID=UPI003863B6B6
MKFRSTRTAVAVAAAALALTTTGLTGSASATATGDNESASVWGPQEGWLPSYSADVPCPVGAICIYTKPLGGVHFELPHCTTYNLYNWNGIGGWYSRQTGNTWARFMRSNGSTIYPLAGPEQHNWNYDYNPVYHVRPC